MKTLRKPNGLNVNKIHWLNGGEVYMGPHVLDLERGFGLADHNVAYPVLTHFSSGAVLCYVKDMVDAHHTAQFLCNPAVYPNPTLDWTRHTSQINADLTRLWLAQGFDFKRWQDDKNTATFGIVVRTWPDDLLAT